MITKVLEKAAVLFFHLETIEAAGYSEKLENTHHTTHRRNPEDNNLSFHRSENDRH
jgi:hypothetical protein